MNADLQAGEPVLVLDQLRCGYGQAVVVRDVSISMAAGEVLALLGKNGMGKSTLLKGIMGFLPRMGGAVRYLGKPVATGKPHGLARNGVAWAPQEQALFQDLSVEENLKLVVRDKALLRKGLERIGGYFPFIPKRLKQKAGTLSGGEQKMLILSRSLMMEPKLLLVDEITEGLQPTVVARIAGVLAAERRAAGLSILLIEQHVGFALEVADRFTVLDRGEIADQGRAADPDAARRIMQKLSV
jgi:urea transport system ATP-binding protein